MNNLPCVSQNTGTKNLPADACVFGHFGRISPAAVRQLTADLTPEWSGGSMFHSLSHIYAKTPFCCVETVANKALYRWHVVFNWLGTNAVPILNTAFSLTNIHVKWWMHCLLISSTPLLSHTTSIYDRPKGVCGVFSVFQNNCWIRVTWVFSIPPLNHCFQWSSVWITLIHPLLCLNSIFSHQKAMLYQDTKFRFSY